MKEMNIATFVDDKARRRGNHRILFYRNASLAQWTGITWIEFAQKVNAIANALVSIDVEEEDNVAIISQNMPHCLIVDFALYANRAVAVPMFATLSSSQIAYILNDAQVKLIFVGEQAQFDAVLEAQKISPTLKRIVVFDNSVDLRDCKTAFYFSELMKNGEILIENAKIVAKRQQKASKEDLANIIYTSGTTGFSKGVMISHENIDEAMRIHAIRLDMKRCKVYCSPLLWTSM